MPPGSPAPDAIVVAPGLPRSLEGAIPTATLALEALVPTAAVATAIDKRAVRRRLAAAIADDLSPEAVRTIFKELRDRKTSKGEMLDVLTGAGIGNTLRDAAFARKSDDVFTLYPHEGWRQYVRETLALGLTAQEVESVLFPSMRVTIGSDAKDGKASRATLNYLHIANIRAFSRSEDPARVQRCTLVLARELAAHTGCTLALYTSMLTRCSLEPAGSPVDPWLRAWWHLCSDEALARTWAKAIDGKSQVTHEQRVALVQALGSAIEKVEAIGISMESTIAQIRDSSLPASQVSFVASVADADLPKPLKARLLALAPLRDSKGGSQAMHERAAAMLRAGGDVRDFAQEMMAEEIDRSLKDGRLDVVGALICACHESVRVPDGTPGAGQWRPLGYIAQSLLLRTPSKPGLEAVLSRLAAGDARALAWKLKIDAERARPAAGLGRDTKGEPDEPQATESEKQALGALRRSLQLSTLDVTVGQLPASFEAVASSTLDDTRKRELLVASIPRELTACIRRGDVDGMKALLDGVLRLDFLTSSDLLAIFTGTKDALPMRRALEASAASGAAGKKGAALLHTMALAALDARGLCTADRGHAFRPLLSGDVTITAEGWRALGRASAVSSHPLLLVNALLGLPSAAKRPADTALAAALDDLAPDPAGLVLAALSIPGDQAALDLRRLAMLLDSTRAGGLSPVSAMREAVTGWLAERSPGEQLPEIGRLRTAVAGTTLAPGEQSPRDASDVKSASGASEAEPAKAYGDRFVGLDVPLEVRGVEADFEALNLRGTRCLGDEGRFVECEAAYPTPELDLLDARARAALGPRFGKDGSSKDRKTRATTDTSASAACRYVLPAQLLRVHAKAEASACAVS